MVAGGAGVGNGLLWKRLRGARAPSLSLRAAGTNHSAVPGSSPPPPVAAAAAASDIWRTFASSEDALSAPLLPASAPPPEGLALGLAGKNVGFGVGTAGKPAGVGAGVVVPAAVVVVAAAAADEPAGVGVVLGLFGGVP